MRYVSSFEEFNTLRARSKYFLDASKNLPENVFQRAYRHYLFIAFDEVQLRTFFCRLKSFIGQRGEKKFIYLVLDPAPEEYANDQTEFYKAVEFSTDDSEEEFIKALNAYSGHGRPDCIMDHSDQILVFSESGSWCVYANRDADIAICAFHDHRCNEFASIYGNDLLPIALAAAKFAYGNGAASGKFLESYSAKMG